MINFLKTNYTQEEIREISEYGCESGTAGLIYYSETCALFDEHEEEIVNIVREMIEEGLIEGLKWDYVIDGELVYKTNVLWLVVEYLAYRIVLEEGE